MQKSQRAEGLEPESQRARHTLIDLESQGNKSPRARESETQRVRDPERERAKESVARVAPLLNVNATPSKVSPTR